MTQARADLAELVSRVGYSGERILLTRHGKALAALVPVSDLEKLERTPAEIGFSITQASRQEQEQDERPAKPRQPEPRPMRIAAEHRRPRRSGGRG